MYLFSFPNSLKCYITVGGIIGCDSENLPRLRLLGLKDMLKVDHWFHLTVSGQSQNGNAYLMLSDSERGILRKSEVKSDFTVTQKTDDDLKACLGDCSTTGFGFEGGLREFIVLKAFMESEEANTKKNYRVHWKDYTLAAWRFNGEPGKTFERDAFMDKWWEGIRPRRQIARLSEYIGTDVMVSDVCPHTH